MKHYTELTRVQRAGFDVIVDKTWEDIGLDYCFDTSIDPDTGLPYYDVEQMARDVDSGDLDWFVLRARVSLEGVELGSSYLGGCLYADARETLEDGTAEDLIYQALDEARDLAVVLQQRITEVLVDG
jgi:hypothetical protein